MEGEDCWPSQYNFEGWQGGFNGWEGERGRFPSEIQSEEGGQRDIETEGRKKKIRRRLRNSHFRSRRRPLFKDRDTLVVIAALMVGVALQIVANPPGGAWQDNTAGHKPGSSIMASTERQVYDILMLSTTITLSSSLSLVFFVISGFPTHHIAIKLSATLVRCSIVPLAGVFYISLCFLSTTSPDKPTKAYIVTKGYSLCWTTLALITSLTFAIRFTVKKFKLWKAVIAHCSPTFLFTSLRERIREMFEA